MGITAKKEALAKSLATFLAMILAFAAGVALVIIFRRSSNEEFSAESFASTVVAQNPKVFERLAEM